MSDYPLPADVEDVEAAPPPDDRALREVADLARRQIELEAEVAAAEAALREKREALDEVADRLLPDAMLAVGVSSFDLAGGGSIRIVDTWAASIPSGARAKDPIERERLSKSRERALAWLVANGHGAIIKRTVEMTFGRGEGAFADRLIDLIGRNFPHRGYADKESVHPQTLGALIRELVAIGAPGIPLDDLGARHIRRAEVELP